MTTATTARCPRCNNGRIVGLEPSCINCGYEPRDFAPLDIVGKQPDRHACLDCGATVKGRDITRCRSCFDALNLKETPRA